uniref:Nucleotide pyrophosphohydrolase domain-containing protein n=1 Tax=viral metagenome TaxID=1070528 RepID=A0A6M3J1E1_9ZZZZ
MVRFLGGTMKDWISKIQAELERASNKFGKFNSTHEGYAVIQEEVDELWHAIKRNESIDQLEIEAVQVSAMALRFLIDCCENEPAQGNCAIPKYENQCGEVGKTPQR